jgi:hypothetical protein
MRPAIACFATAAALVGGWPGLTLRWVQAQDVSLSTTVGAQWVRNSLILERVPEHIAGLWTGGAAEIKLGALVLGGHGFRGKLRAGDRGFAFDRTAGEVRALIRFEPVRWVGVEGSYTVRAFSSAAGYQRWDISAVGIVLSTTLGHPAVRAYAKGSALPSVFMGSDTSTVVFTSNGQSPSLRFASEIGLKVAPSRVPLLFAMHYRFERYDFGIGPEGRLEQVDAVGVSVGYRLGR